MKNLLSIVTLAAVLAAASPARAEEYSWIPGPLWKLTRGLVNAATGLPQEVFLHGVGAPTTDPNDTAGSYLTSAVAGTVTGLGYGVVRMCSGIADVVTFPIPFDDKNDPLMQPEFAL